MTATTDLAIERIGQIAINVKDVARATAFYRDTLGLRPLFRFGQLSFFDCGGVRLMLSPAETPEFDHPSSVLYFKVPKISMAFEALIAKGVTVVSEAHLIAKMPDHDLWMAFFRDSEDNLLALMSEEPKASS
jgi:methylmalonyl-CoA/ethylmalonyl-CoA epimerase